MPKTETLEEYIRHVAPRGPQPAYGPDGMQFNAYRLEDLTGAALVYTRRDFHKICLMLGIGRLHHADKTIVVDRPALLFFNPHVPYSWEDVSAPSGYACVFTESFLAEQHHRSASLQDSPLFSVWSEPVLFLDAAEQQYITGLFQEMLAELHATYPYKYDLLRTQVNLLVHRVLKLQPAAPAAADGTAAHRLAEQFGEVLERQFPIDSPQQTLRLRTARDYAAYLAVHPSHLNRAVKEVTGKTVTTHIADRVTAEARALLRHTDWQVAQIAYCLGFTHPAYFNNFFRKQTGTTPLSLRAVAV